MEAVPDANADEDLELSVLADGLGGLVDLLQQVGEEPVAGLCHLRDRPHAAVGHGVVKVDLQTLYTQPHNNKM